MTATHTVTPRELASANPNRTARHAGDQAVAKGPSRRGAHERLRGLLHRERILSGVPGGGGSRGSTVPWAWQARG